MSPSQSEREAHDSSRSGTDGEKLKSGKMIDEGLDYLGALWARVPASRLSAATTEKFDEDKLYIVEL